MPDPNQDCSRAVHGACPSNCAGHGMCADGKCACDPGYGGEACEVALASPGCPASCSGKGRLGRGQGLGLGLGLGLQGSFLGLSPKPSASAYPVP